jgi:Glucodextranase, domain N
MVGWLSRLWFTLGFGIVNEVYYPRVDIPQIRDLGFIIADGEGFWAEVKRVANYRMRLVAPGVPAVEIVHQHERYSLPCASPRLLGATCWRSNAVSTVIRNSRSMPYLRRISAPPITAIALPLSYLAIAASGGPSKARSGPPWWQ